MDASVATPAPAGVEKKRWKCELHAIFISLGHGCYECQREIKGNASIESEFRTPEAGRIRERNAQPRLRL